MDSSTVKERERVKPADVLKYPFEPPKADGSHVEIAPGLLWLRMPMPMALDHINVYLLRDGDAVTLIANGTLTHRMMKAADLLAAEGIEARVLNMATVRPIDAEAIVAAARDTGAILTAEEHSVYGGLGSAIAEVVVDRAPVPMKLLGVPGIFAPTGSAEFLLDEFGMSPAAVAESAKALIARKH